MGKIKCLTKPDEFIRVEAASLEFGETNDCAVIAVAIACGVPYAKALETLRSIGRKPRRGASDTKIVQALRLLGKRTMVMDKISIIRSHYPGIHGKVLKSITTHHPARFPKVWKDGNTYLFHTTNHVLTVINGVTQDWSADRAMRVVRVVKVY